MATSNNKHDIDEMFHKMGEKLGWFKNCDGKGDQTLFTLNAKKITPMKIKDEPGDGIVGCKSTGIWMLVPNLNENIGLTVSQLFLKKPDGKKRNRLKLRKKSMKAGSESSEKMLSCQSRCSNITKPQSFQALLSSDSEEDKQVPLKNSNKICQSNAVLCSDSDDDKPLPIKSKLNDTVTCVGESFVAPHQSRKPSASLSRHSDCDYNDTIVQKRVSIASCTLDIDNLGDPLVESTRIHRRSSVSYRQIIEEIDESDTSANIDNERKVEKNDANIDELVDDSAFVCDETKFVTAIENFELLNLCPESPIETEHRSYSEGCLDESNRENKGNNLSGNKTLEEVEVIDTGTQTDDVPDIENECFTTDSSRKSDMFAEETAPDCKCLDDGHPFVNTVYNEETIEEDTDIQQSQTDSYSETTECVSDVNNYSGMTENSLIATDSKEKSIYYDITETENALHIFDELTDAGITDDLQRDIYQEDTVNVSDIPENLTATSENCNQRNMEIFAGTCIENASESEGSEYEVNDVGTQTEEIHSTLKSRPSEEVERTHEISNGNSEHSAEVMYEKGSPDSGDESSCNDSETSDDPVHLETKENRVDVLLDDSASGTDESFNEIAQSVKQIRTDKNGDCKDGVSQKVEEQSWRSRKYSDSSDSDQLESFFQKMKGKPKPIESESSSSVSIDDFIVEDDDMTSESDDSVFYLKETQKLNKSPDYVPRSSSSDYSDTDGSEELDDEAQSSESGESGNQRHMKVEKKSAPVSFSSDDDNLSLSPPSVTKKTRKTVKACTSVDSKVKKKLSKLQKSRIDFEISSCSDSDNDEVDLPEIVSDVKPRNKVMKGSDCDKAGECMKDSLPATNETEMFKTPKPIRRKKFTPGKENQFKTPTSVTKSSVSSKGYISLSDNDTDSDSTDFVATPSPSVRIVSGTPKTTKGILTPVAVGANKKVDSIYTSIKGSPTCTFLKSLSCNIADDRRHSEAKKYVKAFKKNKEELSAYLFTTYNRTVFDNKLPRDMSLTWNKRLLRTAGYCAYKKNVKNPEDRTARIELSTKVCDSAERTRDTLIHEMCHAAVWLLNGVNGGHGAYWKYWARHATRMHPELPSISRCHSYSINTKFTYRCKKCGYSIGRHSKSLDTKKKVCGLCRGEFELIQNSEPTTPSSASSSIASTPRQPNKFALFVKENYNSVKKRKQDLKHGDVMKELSKMFAESKISS